MRRVIGANKPQSRQQKPVSKRGSARRTRSVFRQALSVSGVVLCLILGGVGVWFTYSAKPMQFISHWMDGHLGAVWAFTGKAGLSLQHIYIGGKRHTPNDAIVEALGVKLGQPILSIPLKEVKTRLEVIDWVKYATVERQLPGTLHVRVVERTPLAIWQKDRKLYLVDDEGVMIEENHFKPFNSLLILVGDDAPLYARSLLDIIKEEPELYKEITAAVRIGERRWNIRFASGLEVKLPEDNTQEAWHYVIELFREKKLFNTNVTNLDLRIKDKMYVKMAPEEVKNSE